MPPLMVSQLQLLEIITTFIVVKLPIDKHCLVTWIAHPALTSEGDREASDLVTAYLSLDQKPQLKHPRTP